MKTLATLTCNLLFTLAACDAEGPSSDTGSTDTGSMNDAGGMNDAGVMNDVVMDGSVAMDVIITPDATTRDSSAASTVRILFPPPCAYPGDTIVVWGEAGGTAVRIHGIDAESEDGFQTWHARVPLVEGENLLRLENERAEVVDEVLVVRGSSRGEGRTPGRPLGIAWDDAHQRVLLTDDYIDGLWTIDFHTGDRSALSSGVGHEMVRPTGLIVEGSHAFVADGNVIVSVDLTSAEHTVVSGTPGRECPSCPPGGPPRGDGPLGPVRGLAMYEGRLLALMNEVGLVEVNQETGARTLFEAGWENATSLAIDDGLALITPVYSETLHVIDLASRERSSFAGEGGKRVVVVGDQRIVSRGGDLFRVDEGILVPLLDANVPAVTGVRALASGPHYLLAVTHHPSWEDPPEQAPRVLAIDVRHGTVVTLSAP